MDDPQQPTESKPPPVPVPLDYRRPDSSRTEPRTHIVAQLAMGFGFWLAALGVFFASVRLLNDFGIAMAFIAPVELAAVLAFSIWLRTNYRWRGFIPGVLIGLGLTCLVPIGIVAVACANMQI